ncbi:DUF2878 domain-containing protein [Variovorax sp. LT2P21]|uniref:DUF2878 domain-containing protein n=1 Tax=Variovorax sp. LT2P21 TaxID=3443731 RepID=UPI003F4724B9
MHVSVDTALPSAMSPTLWPTRAMQWTNAVVFQCAWFAAVLGAAHERPLLGTACVAAAVAWHLAVSARPAREALLVALACLIGVVVESAIVRQGHVAYPSGQPWPTLAPYWIVALWGLLAIALNVTMRWLRGRTVLAAVMGAALGPLSFSSGARLGGAQLLHPTEALGTLALVWAVLMPVMVTLATRFDGVAVPEPARV